MRPMYQDHGWLSLLVNFSFSYNTIFLSSVSPSRSSPVNSPFGESSFFLKVRIAKWTNGSLKMVTQAIQKFLKTLLHLSDFGCDGTKKLYCIHKIFRQYFKGDQYQFSPNNIHTSSTGKVGRINKKDNHRKTSLVFDQILSSISLRNCMEISLENLYKDIMT